MIDIRWGEIVQRFMVALLIVIIDKLGDCPFQFLRGVIILQLDNILHGAVPAFDLALGHGVKWRTADVFHLLALDELGQVPRKIGWTVIR